MIAPMLDFTRVTLMSKRPSLSQGAGSLSLADVRASPLSLGRETVKIMTRAGAAILRPSLANF
jgi:hypothetical protein